VDNFFNKNPTKTPSSGEELSGPRIHPSEELSGEESSGEEFS
jgi:hypothetical protein